MNAYFALAGKIKSHKNAWVDQKRCHRVSTILISQVSKILWKKVSFTRELWWKCWVLSIIGIWATLGGTIRIFRYLLVQKHVLTKPFFFPDLLACLKLYERVFGHNTFFCGFLFFVLHQIRGIFIKGLNMLFIMRYSVRGITSRWCNIFDPNLF